jgi:hypothetical protein
MHGYPPQSLISWAKNSARYFKGMVNEMLRIDVCRDILYQKAAGADDRVTVVCELPELLSPALPSRGKD